MKPIDPRLLRYARATRFFLGASVGLGLAGAGLVIAQAMLIAEVVVGAFQRGIGPDGLVRPLVLLAGVAVGRAAVSWLTELAAHRASAAVKSELRMRLLGRAVRLGPDWLGSQRTGELTALATRGIDALDDYFARYLPQLGLAVVVPVAVLARIVTADWVSALVIALTLPLIPVFMVLIGWATQSRMDRQWRLLSRLSGHFLDVVAGLATLKVFGRAKAQAESIRAITSDYRRATVRTLRIAFLSSFALELLATVSVALVAVGIGMRLVAGEMDLYTGLMVLILAPEAYLPLRQVGAQYHAAAEGLAAAEEVFAVLEREPGTARDAAPVPGAAASDVQGEAVPGAPWAIDPKAPLGAALTVERLVVLHPGRIKPSLAETSFEVRPGETVAIVGPSGVGKTTLLNAVLGFAEPAAGRVLAGGKDVRALPAESWHAQVAWVPQRPYLFAGTVEENVRLARPDADDVAVRTALRDAGALDFVSALPEGLATRLGENGAGLSAGQRQRVALARAFLADRPVLLLDEPTASLDGETEAAVVDAVRRLSEGRTVVLVVHRPALLPLADRVLHLPGAGSGRHGAPPAAAVPDLDPVVEASPGVRARPAERGGGATEDASVVSESQGAPVADRTRPADGPRRGAGSALGAVRSAGRAWWGRFALALGLGSLALGSAVGLMAVSGWLISRASQEPPVLYLMVAVTATRAFGMGRAVFRYAERLVSHDAVLRVLAELRVSVYRRLERLAPAGLRDARRGDLLSRLVADVDALQDYFLRWLLPVGSAVVVGAASVGFTAWVLPEAGAVLAAGLLAAGVGVPLVSGACARHAERQLAPARGGLSAQVVDLLAGTAEFTVAGALPRRLEAVRRADGGLTRIARRAATATAVGAGLSALACGLTVAAAAWVGVRAVADGRLDGVWLAVVVLTPLAAFEAVAGLPLAVQYRQRVRRAAERVHEVLDAPSPVGEATGPAEARDGPAREVKGALSARRSRRAVPGRWAQRAGDHPGRVPTRATPAARGADAPPGEGEEPARRPAGRPWARTACGPGRGDWAQGSGAALPGQALRALRASRGERAEAVPSARASGGDDATSGPGPGLSAGPAAAFPLVVRELTARHPGQRVPALDGFGLELGPGRRVAVVGVSGAGKTTLAHVLLRFLDAESGTYTLAGRDAVAMDDDAVRRLVGLCAQDAHIFDSSLRENLRLARTDASDEELWGALRAARLAEFAAGLPDGLDTLVGEHGARLSGGQRQRLALARALLADFPVLVLDEPAEHLDLPTADALTADLLAATQGRTTVLITHRLKGLEVVDEVIVLDGGRTVQRGAYEELAAARGPFRRMLERERAAEAGELVPAVSPVGGR